LHTSAIILAGGFSSRFGQDKGLVRLANKPLIRYVLDAVDNVVDERMVVVSSKVQAEGFAKVVGLSVDVFVDVDGVRCPLAGALTGFEEACGEYGLVLACDTPFVSRDVLLLLLDLCVDRNAVIPRWPNGYIEPLHAVYCAKSALVAAKGALSEGKLNMRSMVDALRGVRYVSTLVLEQLDPDLRTFFNINSPLDLKKAEVMLRHV
jgi:molybdopterin-guanine dinucleotide biosynthesis protein A